MVIKYFTLNNSQKTTTVIFKTIANIMIDRKEVYMKRGTIVSARTHGEFLSAIFGRKFKGWGKCTYHLSKNMVLWFIRLNGKQSKEGWTNSLVNDGKKITEIYTGNPEKRCDSHKNPDFTKKRAVFDIIENGASRKYIFRGVFTFDFDEGNNDKRIWDFAFDDIDF